jgi:hypothetical protein
MDMALVKTPAAPDAFVLVDHVAVRPFAVYGVDRAIRDAFTATVAFYVDIDLGAGLDKVDETPCRAFIDGDDEIFLA